MSTSRKSIVKKRLSNVSENIPPHILKLLMDPVKRKLVWDIIAEHSNPINEQPKTPKQKVIEAIKCESPVALFRRRALEQQNSPKTPTQPKQPMATSSNTPLTPKNVILKNVVVYVDVVKNNQDKSKKYKDIVESLGGTVKDCITSSVTHVVFKAGSYTTYDRAKLINAHLVSVKWVTDCVKYNKRMKERLYSPFGPNISDISTTDRDSSPEKTSNCKEVAASLTCSSMSSLRVSVNTCESNTKETRAPASKSSTSPRQVTSPSANRKNTDTSLNSSKRTKSRGSFNSSKSPFSPLNKTQMSDIMNTISDNDPAEFVTVRKKTSTKALSKKSPDKNLTKSINQEVKETRKKNTRRKLYTPNDSIPINYSSEDERNELRQRKIQQICKENGKVPDIVHNAINKACEKLIDESSSDESEIDYKIMAQHLLEKAVQKEVKKSKAKKRFSVEDEQKELADIFVAIRDGEKSPSKSEGIGTTADNSPLKTVQSQSDRSVRGRKSMANINSNNPDLSNKETKKLTGRRSLRKRSVVFESSESDSSPKKTKPTTQTNQRVILRRSMRISSIQENKLANNDNSSDSEDSPKKFKRPIARRHSVRVSEKAKLPNEVLKTPKTPKRPPRKLVSQSEKKATSRKRPILNQKSESDELNSPLVAGKARRSTLDFLATSAYKSIKIRKIRNTNESSIVVTKMSRGEIDLFEETVEKLGRFVVENTVNKKTTHLVVGNWGRTLNLLKAMILGCWILRKEWFLDSLKAGKWLPEEKYEITDQYPAIQTCRMQRQAFGSPYSMDIFRDCGYIYINYSTHPPPIELKGLITLCQGKITNLARNAQIIVGKFVNQDYSTCVQPNWILDSITQNRKLPFKKYLLEPVNRHSFAV